MYLHYPSSYVSLPCTLGLPGCISPDFFKLRGKSFPAFSVLAQSQSQLQTSLDHALPQGCPIYIARNDQQPSTRRVLPEYSMHKPGFLYLGQWERAEGKVRLEPRRGVYMAQHSTEQTAKWAPALINLNKYQQWIASESNRLFFWKYPTNLF